MDIKWASTTTDEQQLPLLAAATCHGNVVLYALSPDDAELARGVKEHRLTEQTRLSVVTDNQLALSLEWSDRRPSGEPQSNRYFPFFLVLLLLLLFSF